MAITIKRTGIPGHGLYPVVEPNHLSAPRSGGVYAQLPLPASINAAFQGQFFKYDLAGGALSLTGDTPWVMVYNEEKLYDPARQMHRDYAMVNISNDPSVKLVPRVFRLYVGDIYTTNCVKDGDSYTVGDKLVPGTAGILEKKTAITADDTLVCKVVKETTLPDGQAAVKLQVIRAN